MRILHFIKNEFVLIILDFFFLNFCSVYCFFWGVGFFFKTNMLLIKESWFLEFNPGVAK